MSVTKKWDRGQIEQIAYEGNEPTSQILQDRPMTRQVGKREYL